MKCFLLSVLCFFLVLWMSDLEPVHASLDPSRIMSPQDVATREKRYKRYAELRDRFHAAQNELSEMEEQTKGFLIGIVLVSVAMGFLLLLCLYSCLKHFNNTSAIERLQETKYGKAMYAPLRPRLPEPEMPTYTPALPVFNAVPNVSHAHGHSHDSPHNHGHSHGHGHGFHPHGHAH